MEGEKAAAVGRAVRKLSGAFARPPAPEPAPTEKAPPKKPVFVRVALRRAKHRRAVQEEAAAIEVLKQRLAETPPAPKEPVPERAPEVFLPPQRSKVKLVHGLRKGIVEHKAKKKEELQKKIAGLEDQKKLWELEHPGRPWPGPPGTQEVVEVRGGGEEPVEKEGPLTIEIPRQSMVAAPVAGGSEVSTGVAAAALQETMDDKKAIRALAMSVQNIAQQVVGTQQIIAPGASMEFAKEPVVEETISLGDLETSELTDIGAEWQEVSKVDVDVTFPLIRESEGGPVVVSGNIKWSPEDKALVYKLIEPPLYPQEHELLRKIETKLEDTLDVTLAELGPGSINYLREQFMRLIDIMGVKLSQQQVKRFEYYIFRDFVGLNEVEPLMHDSQIEDISCDGVSIPMYIVHRNPEYSQLKTNVMFKDKEQLDFFVTKLAQRCNKAISVASPLLDGVLPDGSRVQATLASDIARRGSNFTIRKFTEKPFTPVDILKYKTMDAVGLAYVWMMVEYGKSILIAGATATGKTSLMNSISLFIKPELKVVSIEDTGELQLPHENWIPEVSRTGTGEKGYGTVEMFDLLKAALRQRPDYVIVGEVRGAEASVMFQGMATGHPAMGTLHADDVAKVVDRLTTPPINLSAAMLENLNIIIFLVRTKLRGKYVRRVREIVEIKQVDPRTHKIVPNVVFEWEPTTDKLLLRNPSLQLSRVAQFRGISNESILEEMRRRATVLKWMTTQDITDYKAFADQIAKYYADPAGTAAYIKEQIDKAKAEAAAKVPSAEGAEAAAKAPAAGEAGPEVPKEGGG